MTWPKVQYCFVRFFFNTWREQHLFKNFECFFVTLYLSLDTFNQFDAFLQNKSIADPNILNGTVCGHHLVITGLAFSAAPITSVYTAIISYSHTIILEKQTCSVLFFNYRKNSTGRHVYPQWQSPWSNLKFSSLVRGIKVIVYEFQPATLQFPAHFLNH